MTDAPAADLTRGVIQHGDAEDILATLDSESFDLAISSPPYNIRKPYERNERLSLTEYEAWQTRVVQALTRVMKPSASICWQVGNYVSHGELYPLDIFFYRAFMEAGWKLRNRIIWRFNFGLHSTARLSGRYETILWFSKGDHYKFNLDNIRVPQLYPGKRHASSKSGKGGKPSGNPKGKNPSDYWEFSAPAHFIDNPVWEIPNVKSNHLEQTSHPCQFPTALAERCVLAFTDEGDRVIDPFTGTGTSVIAAVMRNRGGLGIDKEQAYVGLARDRLHKLAEGTLPIRPSDRPVRQPRSNEAVSQFPAEWRKVG